MLRHVACAAFAVVLTVGAAAGHAVLDRTDPRAGVSVKTAPSQVKLWFTGALEPAYSRVQVLDGAGKRTDLGDGGVDTGNPALLRVSVPALGPGTYRVVWHVLSVDSHVTEGQFSFQVAR
jgi:methionine-rich copper-binding protein CopC